MEDLVMRKQPAFMPTSTPSPLAMHKNSHTIAKVKPKIRIIHIFAPEIIKTDVANFRELVQRLTGKPNDDHRQKGCKNNKKPRRGSGRNNIVQDHHHHQLPRSCSSNHLCDVNKKVELRSGFGSLGVSRDQRVKEEEEAMWNGANSGGFLGGFADLDGFIQELGEFPLLPVDADDHMQGFEEAQLA